IPHIFGLAVERDNGDPVRCTAHHVAEHRSGVAKILEVTRSGPSGLHQDNDGQWLALHFFDGNLLLYAVVGEAEVSGLESIDEVAGRGPHQRGDNDQRRGRSDCRWWSWRHG